jgi:hypothetical protein
MLGSYNQIHTISIITTRLRQSGQNTIKLEFIGDVSPSGFVASVYFLQRLMTVKVKSRAEGDLA